ncbi:hypothetical protein FITA111629_09505 [Filibacter tadaridae]|uniref:Uncharacterized protein n=1 Tax=Filibacter tadaridae TaxID=2483811 RepID=A0A3P5XNH4_9BACL|nr:hypothetical protein [Filibacter tadaridae]VDC31901.1 hypothetical protein FILTAD_02502 [Filibacter tadaridae]
MNAILMPFLYFPEDKTEYIPAIFSSLFFFILLVLTFMWFMRNSKKQEQETKELEQRILRERKEANENQPPQD